MLVIKNDGARIRDTNFWDSDPAKRGFFFLSWNANTARLLVPDEHRDLVDALDDVRYVIVSRGPWVEQGGRDALELLFETDTAQPYAIHLVSEQTDWRIAAERARGFDVVLWTRAGPQHTWPGRYRMVAAIPCLARWREH